MSQAPAPDEAFVPPISHDEFRRGAAFGHFRIVVNPALARPYLVRRTRVDLLAAVVIGAGAVLALMGQALPGVVLVVLGIAANRLVRRQAVTSPAAPGRTTRRRWPASPNRGSRWPCPGRVCP